MRILKYIFVVATINLCLADKISAMEKADTIKAGNTTVTIESTPEKAPVFGGVSVSADLVGVIMKLSNSSYSQMEAAAKLNFKEKYFPVFEIGIGESDYEGSETGNTYKTAAPYFRIGMDYNFNKNWKSGNRMYAGVRYGFTNFKYDISVPGFSDPVWNTPIEFTYKNIQGNQHWGEILFGLEAKIWSIFHLGWSVRYKVRFKHKDSAYGSPWYIPGYGKNSTSSLGGTFNIIFDI